MHACAAAGAAFLLAVLWFDLMFDVQAAGVADGALPPDILLRAQSLWRSCAPSATPWRSASGTERRNPSRSWRGRFSAITCIAWLR
jgi:hypothetical protein